MSEFKNTDPEEIKKEKKAVMKIDKEKQFDIEENMMMSMLHNMKRADTLEQARHFCESIGLPAITDSRLIKLYNNSRDKLFEYRLESIAQEKEKVVKRMYRLGCKAETRGDFANAFKCYDRIAELAGVNKESDESKVILNFIPARPKIMPAETLLVEPEIVEKKEKEDDGTK